MTLGEKSTSNNPYYTWKISNRNSFDEYIFAPDNNSTSNYYDSFTISIGTPSVSTASVVINAVPGEYHYEIYESLTQYNLDITGLGMVESGLLIIQATFSTPNAFTESNSDTIRVFNEL